MSIFRCVAKFFRPLTRFITKHAATILVVAGSGLLVATTVSGIDQAPKGLETIDNANAEVECIEAQDKPVKEIRREKIGARCRMLVQLVKDFARTIALGIASLLCFWSAHIKLLRDLATTANTVSALSNQIDRMNRKHLEKYGTEEHENFRREVTEAEVSEMPSNLDEIRILGHRGLGDIPCKLDLTQQWFWTNEDRIRDAEDYYHDIGMLGNPREEDGIPLNEYLDRIGYPATAGDMALMNGRYWDFDNVPHPVLRPVWFKRNGIELAIEMDFSRCLPMYDSSFSYY